MATGFSKTIEVRHEYDYILDYRCTTCERKNLDVEALFYCTDCRKLFCEGCEQFHDKFTEGHTVLGKNDVAKWGDVKPVVSSLMCDDHPGKELELFCEDHDRVCCSICTHMKHRACKRVKSVSHVAMGIQNESKLKRLLSEAAKTQSRLKMMYDKREKNIKQLQQTREEIVSTLNCMKKKINQTVDRIEEKTLKEMDKTLTKLKEQATSEKDACLHFHDKIQKLLRDFKSSETQCGAMVFQGYKICAEQTESAKTCLATLPDVDYRLKFTPDVKIEQYLTKLETLGNFISSKSCIDEKVKNDRTVSTRSKTQIKSNRKTRK